MVTFHALGAWQRTRNGATTVDTVERKIDRFQRDFVEGSFSEVVALFVRGSDFFITPLGAPSWGPYDRETIPEVGEALLANFGNRQFITERQSIRRLQHEPQLVNGLRAEHCFYTECWYRASRDGSELLMRLSGHFWVDARGGFVHVELAHAAYNA